MRLNDAVSVVGMLKDLAGRTDLLYLTLTMDGKLSEDMLHESRRSV